MVPEQRMRTETFFVNVPEQREVEQSFTTMVPEQRTRTETFTVKVPVPERGRAALCRNGARATDPHRDVLCERAAGAR